MLLSHLEALPWTYLPQGSTAGLLVMFTLGNCYLQATTWLRVLIPKTRNKRGGITRGRRFLPRCFLGVRRDSQWTFFFFNGGGWGENIHVWNKILINKDQLYYLIKIGWRHIHWSKCDANETNAQTQERSSRKSERLSVGRIEQRRLPHVGLKQTKMNRGWLTPKLSADPRLAGYWQRQASAVHEKWEQVLKAAV